MKKITSIITQVGSVIGATLTLCAGRVMATSVQEGAEAAHVEGMPSELIGPSGIINQATNIVLYIVGFIAVIMLIWGGLRYITSGGDSKKITDAKNTVLYALLGLVVCVFSYAIVNFVLNTIGNLAAPSTESFIPQILG